MGSLPGRLLESLLVLFITESIGKLVLYREPHILMFSKRGGSGEKKLVADSGLL